MEDDLNVLKNGTQSQICDNGRRPQFLICQMEDDLTKIFQQKTMKS